MQYIIIVILIFGTVLIPDCFVVDNSNLMAQFKFSVASPRGANQKMVQHDTG